MSSAPSTVYFVTGANRGLGLGLVTHIADARPDAFVYAGVRDPASAHALKELAAKHPARVAVVKYVSADKEGDALLAKEIGDRHGRVDTVIANAARATLAGPALDTSAEEFLDFYTTNVVGPLVLFQTFHSLLQASAAPRFVTITSGGASLSGPAIAMPIASAAYGSSKAALNYVTRKIHFENEWLTVFPLAPGAVMNDTVREKLAGDHTGEFAALLEKFNIQTPDEAAGPLVALIDGATREKDSGEFLNIDGARLPW